MAKRNRRIRADRIIVIILFAILFAGLLSYGAYSLYNFLGKEKTNKPNIPEIVNPDPIETSKGIVVTQGDYDVYIDDTDKLGFNFVVASLTFSSEEPVSFDLSNFQTSQKYYLNDVSKYLQKLENLGYSTAKLGCVSTVSSTENEYTCKIFIPYTTSDTTLRLLNAVDASMIVYDLDHNIKYLSSLKIDDIVEDKTIEVNNTSITIADSYISTMMIHNGSEYTVGSNMAVYTFEIYVSEIEGNVLINEAYFVPDGTNEKSQCMTADFSSIKADNALGKKLTVGNNGALFFEMPTSVGSTSGTLWIGLSNKLGELVKVSTNLE